MQSTTAEIIEAHFTQANESLFIHDESDARVWKGNGAWYVTKDGIVLGEYLTRRVALLAVIERWEA